mgnify:FL=1
MKYEIISLQPHKVEGKTPFYHFKYLEQQNIVKMEYLEYSLHKQAVRILRGKEKSPLTRIFRNIYRITELLMTKGETLLIGAAAFSIFALIINRLKKRHNCIFYTSWPYWDDATFPKVMFHSLLKKSWRKFLNGTTCVIVTKYAFETLSSYGATCYWIPYAIDTEVLRPKVPRPFSEKTRVLFVGELLKLKGVHLIINIIKKYKWQDTVFWFVGRGRYERDIRDMQEQNYPVRYFGFVEDRNKMMSIMQDADMLILPSIKMGEIIEEKFSITLIEAMSCQLPVIASDCIGPRDTVQDGETGILIPQNDEEALKDAICKLIESPELRYKLGVNGRKKAEKFYDVKEVTKKWLEVLERFNHTEQGFK